MLTLVSCVVLALVLIDLLVPFIIGILFKKDKWFFQLPDEFHSNQYQLIIFRTPAKEAKYTRICERFANFEQHVKDMCEAALKMRKERPLMVFNFIFNCTIRIY